MGKRRLDLEGNIGHVIVVFAFQDQIVPIPTEGCPVLIPAIRAYPVADGVDLRQVSSEKRGCCEMLVVHQALAFDQVGQSRTGQTIRAVSSPASGKDKDNKLPSAEFKGLAAPP